MILLANSYLAMALHAALFKRMVEFASLYSPELPAEPIVMNWLNRFYNNDPTIQVLVTLSERNEVTAHAVLDVQQSPSGILIICHQYQNDKKDLTELDELVEYAKKLKQQINARGIVFFTEKHVQAYEKRYGFKRSRTTMFYAEPDPVVSEDVN